MSALVVGIGNPDRGDDGVGPEVARRIAEMSVPGILVVEHAEPLDLVERLGASEDCVVVVDAARPDGQPGRVHVWRVGVAPLRHAPLALGSHGLGVAEAVELARATGRLPRRLVLVGVEGCAFEVGRPLSAEVRARLDDAVRTVLGLVGAVPVPR